MLDCVGTTQTNSLITLADLSSGKLDEPVKVEEPKDPVEEHVELLGSPETHTVRVKGFSAVHFDIFGRSPIQWFEANGSRVTSDGDWSYLMYEHLGQHHSIRAKSKGGLQTIATGELDDVIKATESLIVAEMNADPSRKLMSASRWLSQKKASDKQISFINLMAQLILKKKPNAAVGFTKDQVDRMSVQTAMVAIAYLIVKLEYVSCSPVQVTELGRLSQKSKIKG